MLLSSKYIRGTEYLLVYVSFCSMITHDYASVPLLLSYIISIRKNASMERVPNYILLYSVILSLVSY